MTKFQVSSFSSELGFLSYTEKHPSDVERHFIIVIKDIFFQHSYFLLTLFALVLSTRFPSNCSGFDFSLPMVQVHYASTILSDQN